jgi:transposase
MGHPSDLTDSQWGLIKPLFDKKGDRGKHLERHSKRDMVNAVLYIISTGCRWRMLPKSYPRYATVYSFYRRAVAGGLWPEIDTRLRKGAMPKNRRRYDNEFKKAAVGLCSNNSNKVGKVAKGLGIHPNRIHAWRRKLALKEEPVEK